MDSANPPRPAPPSRTVRRPRLVVLAGPTAVGKSALALALAEQFSGEIISVDSMQVYRGLDVGTAKPSPAERARVPHHLIDVADPVETFDAVRFAALARAAVAGILARGRLPFLCGGTGLYFKALFEGLGEAPAADEQLRVELRAMPLDELLRELADKDPATFARVDRQNRRRVLRAVEVVRLTGRSLSEQRAAWKRGGDPAGSPAGDEWDLRSFGLTRPPEDLHRRIEARVDTMFARGLVAETEGLSRRGLGLTAEQALGYRQVLEHLRGECTLAEAITQVKVRTRRYAKRQMTWFRGQMSLRWLDAQSAAATIAADLAAGA